MLNPIIELFEAVDQAVGQIYKKHPDEIQCKKGCSDCCHAVFDVSFIEACYLATYLRKHSEIASTQAEKAKKAAVNFEKLIRDNEDFSTARIRCPLLSSENLCLAHSVRPINCRTYGTPTIIDGKSHVCGLSGFNKKKNYPAVQLAPLQQRLNDMSIDLVGKEFGEKRFPIAWVLLKTDFFLPK